VLALRAAFAIAVVVVALWFLSAGMPLGALAVVALCVWLRRAAESGRLLQLVRRRPARVS
jgi:hypothetical protein